MKTIYLLIPVLLLFSCSKDKTPPYTETITKGEKWGIRIGSSPAEVYARLQELGVEKHFSAVAVAYRQPFTTPGEIQSQLPFYQALTLSNTTGRQERVVFEFAGDKISLISAGGALPAEVLKWPEDVPDAVAIHKNDLVNDIYAKLLSIYQVSPYNTYQLILPDKTLSKPFDPGMAGYNEWHFSFSMDVKPGTGGSSSVRLFFKNNRLDKIRHSYNEGEVVI